MPEVSPATTREQQEAAANAAAAAAKAQRAKNAAAQNDRLDKEQRLRDEQNAAAANVMENSRPTPTQRENDLAKLNALHPDDKEDPNNPEMPPLHEQRARAAEAMGDKASYKTREAMPKAADKPKL